MPVAPRVVPVWQSDYTKRQAQQPVGSANPRHLRNSLSGADFANTMRLGRSVRGRCSNMMIRPGEPARARLGLIVPKRLLSRSVDRNRLKRILREWFRSQHDRMQGKDCVVRLTAPVLGRVMEKRLRAELDSFMTKP